MYRLKGCSVRKLGEHSINSGKETMLLLITFRIVDMLRFLSHAELIKVFQRACIRADVELQYSQGFNPHPRMSLPLPKSTGIETDEDILCLKVHSLRLPGGQIEPQTSDDAARFLMSKLSEQLPQGCELLTTSILPAKASCQPSSAVYVLNLQQHRISNDLTRKIKSLLESEILDIERKIDSKGNTRTINVRPFLKSIKLDGQDIIVQCKISSEGSIRPDEILKLFELNVQKLARPIRRTSIQWEITRCNR